MNLCNSEIMKKSIFLLFILTGFLASSQKTENIIIITTDGLRWQEVFKGLDSDIANDNAMKEFIDTIKKELT